MASKVTRKRLEHRSKYFERRQRLQRLSAIVLSSGLALVLWALVVIVSIALFSGCATKEVEKIVEVPMAVPMKCDLTLAPLTYPKRTNDAIKQMQYELDFLRDVSINYDVLTNNLRVLPCINLKESYDEPKEAKE